MSGHGHVTPNADGSKARCGGPGICGECALEAVRAGLTKFNPYATPETDEVVARMSFESAGCGYTVRYWHQEAAEVLAAHARNLERRLRGV